MTTTTYEIDLNMFSFFVSDAKKHLDQIHTAIDKLKKGDHDSNLTGQAVDAVNAINSGAKLCRIPFINELIQTISDEFINLSKNNTHDNPLKYNSIENHLKLIHELVDITPENITDWLGKHENKFTLPENTAPTIINNTTSEPHNQEKNTPPENDPDIPDIDYGMLDLFKIESETQAIVISENLLKLENTPDDSSIIEPLMRAAHSIKGAARMIGLDIIVELAHLMEECFVNTRKGTVTLGRDSIDLLLHCNDILDTIPKLKTSDVSSWLNTKTDAIKSCLPLLDALAANKSIDMSLLQTVTEAASCESASVEQPIPESTKSSHDNSIRIQSTQLNKMLAISNELLVSQNWLQEHQNSLHRLKKQQTNLASSFQKLKQYLDDIEVSDEVFNILLDTENSIEQCRNSLAEDINLVDDFDRKSLVLSSRLNQEVTACRMRPFRECTLGFDRMVRDVSQQLNKDIRFEIDGLDTLVDSDILDSIEAPLTHLIRNAIDHGIEAPEIRTANNKPAHGTIKLHAYHNAGKLNITINDDGKGLELESLKNTIINKGLTNKDMVDNLSESELLDFLFLPGFSTKNNVTELSGRGVGLDIVHSVVTNLRGLIRSHTIAGHGMTITLQLPLTLSVIHTLLTEINNDYYAFPLARIHTVIKVKKEKLLTIEQKQFIKFNNHNISVIHTAQIFGFNALEQPEEKFLNIIILFERGEYYALVVDKLIGEEKLALHQISQHLGKIRDISATALADNGQVVLVLDIDDILTNIHEIINGDRLQSVNNEHTSHANTELKRILVVDDSLTVREVEKNLLLTKGYAVDTAVDGIDGWNTIRQNNYDLIITDIDMPRMNGIELVLQLKDDPRYHSIPVMIVSYKDNPDDRQRGLEAGADYYLTKGSFHDDTLIDAVTDLIGEATR